jgi:ribosomal protein S10
MINYQSTKQIKIEEFKTPFELKLDSSNRWVKLSSIMPWDDLVSVYLKSLSKDEGRRCIDGRIVVGALFIKHKLCLSDEETIETIKENPYIQYFLGLNTYHPDEVFSPTLFVELRKRIGHDKWDKFTKILMNETEDISKLNKEENISNKGKLKLDATVADQYIKYPTDLDLLNESREWSEKIIDELYLKGDFQVGEKPRTYRRIARRDYLNVAKNKKKTKIKIRKGIKKQLNYLNRNINNIHRMFDTFKDMTIPLSKKSHKYLFRIQAVYQQQKEMYDKKEHKCLDRIVSLSQPHVRPIVRGKQKTPVEFGAKLGVSLDNGYVRIDHLSWDSYHEGKEDLKVQVEAYKSIHGYYPELVQTDKIYSTRENRNWLKERAIRITAPPLGRKPKVPESSLRRKKKRQETNERNHIEGKFGQAKNGYNLNKIRAKLKSTSESWIGAIFFVLNVAKFAEKLL